MNWKSGDVAICKKVYYIGHKLGTINDQYPPLQYNSEYPVQDVYVCIKCKRVSLDVGFNVNHARGVICICDHLLPNNGAYWCASERFVKKEFRTEEEVILEEEPIKQFS